MTTTTTTRQHQRERGKAMNNKGNILRAGLDGLVAMASHPAVKVGMVALVAIEQTASVLRQSQAAKLPSPGKK